MARTIKRFKHDDTLRRNPRPKPRRTGTRHGVLTQALSEVGA
jgi:hypothetical protein